MLFFSPLFSEPDPFLSSCYVSSGWLRVNRPADSREVKACALLCSKESSSSMSPQQWMKPIGPLHNPGPSLRHCHRVIWFPTPLRSNIFHLISEVVGVCSCWHEGLREVERGLWYRDVLKPGVHLCVLIVCGCICLPVEASQWSQRRLLLLFFWKTRVKKKL